MSKVASLIPTRTLDLGRLMRGVEIPQIRGGAKSLAFNVIK